VTRLFIVRHALAAAPDDLRLPGPDLSLLPEGGAQAARLARRLLDCAPSAVFASDARRARETGTIVAATCGVSLEMTPALREIDFGEWAGKTYAEIGGANPAARDWFADPTVGTPPGGETIATAAERVTGVLAELAHAGCERAVVVGHAGSLRLALAATLGMPLAAYWRLRLDCASLTIVTWTADGPVLERLNDTAHFATDHSQEHTSGDVMLNEVTDPSPRMGEGGGRGKHLDSGILLPQENEILRFAQDDNSTSAVHSTLLQPAGDAPGHGSRMPGTEDGPR
jgi:broad specificity phosphatase PhoE